MEDLDQNNDELMAQKEREALEARANMLGVKFHPNLSDEKLRERIAEHVKAEASPETDKPVLNKAADTEEKETEGARRMRLKREASELVRVMIACKNPAKKEWNGQIFAAGNTLVGTFRKFVPFENEEGWHIPKILLQQIQDATYQTFYNEKTKGGVTVRKGKLAKEFVVQILDPLTPEELHDLAQRQAMAKSVG